MIFIYISPLTQDGPGGLSGKAGRPACRRDGDFSSLLRVQTAPGVHSTSYKMSTGDFPGVKTAERRSSHPTST